MKAIVISVFVILFACCIASTNPHLNENKSAIVKKESLYGYWSLDGVVWLRITRDRYTLLMKTGNPLFDIHLIKILLPGILMELHLKKI